jgi:MAC/Perforin domain
MRDLNLTKEQTNKPNLPPGLDTLLIACGFDPLNWDFVDQSIFELTYEKGLTIALHHGQDEKVYDVPDGFTANRTYEADGTEVMIFKGLHSIDEEKFSLSLQASLSAYGASASASASVAKYSKIETDDKLTTTTVGYYKTIYRLRRDKFDNLSSAFKDDLKGLPSSYTPDNRGQFDDFFRKWGTHFLTTGFFGGIWVMNTIIEESVFDRLDRQDIKASVEVGFSDGTDKGSAKIDIEQNTMKSLHLDNRQSKITFHSIGGNSNKEIKDWLISVDDIMVFLKDALCMSADATRPIFTPIWQVADELHREALKRAWLEYLPPDKQQDETLPQTVGGQVETNIQAMTDGFLSVLLNVLSSNDWGGNRGEVYVFTDGSPHPGTWIAGTGVDNGGHMDPGIGSAEGAEIPIKINQASVFAPIRRGDYYKVGYNRRFGNLNTNVTFQPFPLGFGAWEPLSFNQLYNGRDKDGFVVAAVYHDGGQWASIIGSQAVNGVLTPCVGSYMDATVPGWTPFVDVLTTSFCMPVVKGSSFRIDLKLKPLVDANAIAKSLFWIPMGPSHRLLPLDFYRPNETNQAHTHGVVTGYLSWPDDHSKSNHHPTFPAVLTIQSALTQNFVNPSTVGFATVQGPPPEAAVVPYNTATAFIAKGCWFRASTASQSTGYSATVSWFGIVPAA